MVNVNSLAYSLAILKSDWENGCTFSNTDFEIMTKTKWEIYRQGESWRESEAGKVMDFI